MSSILKAAVSAVVPTYNGQALLSKHLESVLSCLRSGDELIIVDDASTDSTVEWCLKKFDLVERVSEADIEIWSGLSDGIEVSLLKNKTNQRFGESCNRGVKLAHHDFILLLNNDVRPAKNLLTFLLPHFADEKMFGVGCLEHQGQATSGKNKLWFERGLFFHNRADNQKSGPTAWISGGSGLFERTKWLELGGFDKRFYPAYWEDVDLSFRAQKRGWKTVFEEKAEVEHRHESTNTDVFGQRKIMLMSWRHSLLFTWLHASLAQRIQFLIWLPYQTLHFWLAINKVS